ncbi:MAG: chromosome segregation protein SMC [Oscillibacter sp.]|jgi:chromosome segregation protein|nr:chromosome segregation protein SMC [Oscillibacter sp.]
MYLKALEIQGFKSFPDKTVLNFGEEITAIVGPNGSGKSNISDAIRWVMGEQSTKSLRGTKMEDVIFGGTAKRPQLGFAQVTLILDNTGHIFPALEETEVAVTRRYYRSGESEYYVNRQSVRLRDVTELFLDTGMGREGYSLIGQGKIDEILSTKSGDRRDIFEEAAGISKYRHRKEESERRLERTEENLLRVNDKIAELELQVEPLRDQAEKAKKYLVLRDELRSLEISVWLQNLDELKVEQRKLESDFRAAQENCREAQANLDSLYAEGEKCGGQMQELDLTAEQLRTEASTLDSGISGEESAVAVLESTIAHNRENIRQAEQELEEQDSRTGGLQSRIDAQTARIGEIGERLLRLNGELDALMAQAAEASQRVGGAQTRAEALRGAEALAVAAAADARAECSAAAAESEQLTQRRDAAAQERAGTQERLTAAEAESRSSRHALEDARDEVTAASNVIEGHNLRMEERTKKAAAAAEKKLKLTMDAGAVDNRIRMLREMEKEYEGFSKAVRLVCQAQDSLRGIRGPVAGLMKTDAKYTVAIEIALGAGLQNIVVEREEDAKGAIGFLKRRDGGRATFLPMNTIRGDELREPQLEKESGYVGVASRLISFDGQYRGIFLNLLGRTVIAEDLDCGIAISRKYGNRFRIVTLDGQVINRGGSMTGGSVNQHAGVLSRAAELTALQSRAQELAAQQADAVRTEETLRRELEAAKYELTTAEAQRRAAEDEVLRLESAEKHYQILLDGLRENLENLAGEEKRLAGRLADNALRAAQAEKTVAEQEQAAEKCRADAAEILAGQTELLARSGELGERVSAGKSELAALTAEKETTERALTELQQLRGQMSEARDDKKRQAEACRAAIAQAETEISDHRKNAQTLQAQAQELRDRIAELNRQKLELEAQRTAKNRAGQEMNETLLNLERAASRLEQKLSASAMEEKQILDRLWERYELNHSDAQAQRIELSSMAKATRRIGELKRDMSALGTPNIGAIEEFERVNTRYTYLTGQRDDVEKAKGELEGVIGELTEQMTRIFAQQFALLQKSFQETFADLFGGGQAALELEDPNDILNCGIEIRAQPPGKTLRTISLLSGGEKAFVAIALYFAILKVHPTPFCVMDEIEAALDDANVTRYARYMRTLSDRTQFIVITHRRGTMEESDILYGVTMQEQGVSKILTINLNDMAKELKIK